MADLLSPIVLEVLLPRHNTDSIRNDNHTDAIPLQSFLTLAKPG